MTAILLITLAALLIFAVGVLVGNDQVTRAQDKRERRQAAMQRRINEQWRVLKEFTDLQ